MNKVLLKRMAVNKVLLKMMAVSVFALVVLIAVDDYFGITFPNVTAHIFHDLIHVVLGFAICRLLITKHK